MDGVPFCSRFRDSRRAEHRSVPTGFGRAHGGARGGEGVVVEDRLVGLLIHDHSLLYGCCIYSLIAPILYCCIHSSILHRTIMRLPSIANPYLRTARSFTTSAHLRVPLLLTPKQFNDLPKVSIRPQTVTSFLH